MRSRFSIHGFSLLELLVALVIMAMSLGLIYRASGSAVRQFQLVSSQEQASELLQSLLTVEALPAEGWNETGTHAGVMWAARSALLPQSNERATPRPQHQLWLSVQWEDRGEQRELAVTTVRPLRLMVRAP